MWPGAPKKPCSMLHSKWKTWADSWKPHRRPKQGGSAGREMEGAPVPNQWYRWTKNPAPVWHGGSSGRWSSRHADSMGFFSFWWWMPWAFTFLPYAESGWTSLLVRFHIQMNFRHFWISSFKGTRRVAHKDSWTSMPNWTKFDWRRLWKLENDLHLRVYPCSCSKWLLPYQTSLLWRHLVTGAHTYAQRPAEASDCGMDHGFLTGQSLYFHPHLGKWYMTNTFQMGWNHQLVLYCHLQIVKPSNDQPFG